MKLTHQAITKIDDRKGRLRLALALGFSESWTRRVIKNNKENGPLTTASALHEIAKISGLPKSQILEASELSVAK